MEELRAKLIKSIENNENDAYKKEVAYSIVKILAEGPLKLSEAHEVLEISKDILNKMHFDEECQVIRRNSDGGAKSKA